MTTWSKTKQFEWKVQDTVQKVAKEWVGEVNNNNVTRMLQENTELINTPIHLGISLKEVLGQSSPEDETWRVLAYC